MKQSPKIPYRRTYVLDFLCHLLAFHFRLSIQSLPLAPRNTTSALAMDMRKKYSRPINHDSCLLDDLDGPIYPGSGGKSFTYVEEETESTFYTRCGYNTWIFRINLKIEGGSTTSVFETSPKCRQSPSISIGLLREG
jgi:hypothetical protein